MGWDVSVGSLVARTSKIQKWFDSMSVGEEIAPEEGGT